MHSHTKENKQKIHKKNFKDLNTLQKESKQLITNTVASQFTTGEGENSNFPRRVFTRTRKTSFNKWTKQNKKKRKNETQAKRAWKSLYLNKQKKSIKRQNSCIQKRRNKESQLYLWNLKMTTQKHTHTHRHTLVLICDEEK